MLERPDAQELIDHFKSIPGALSVTEAVALYLIITNNSFPSMQYAIDLGSHAGKSSCIGASALTAAGVQGHFIMVDPLYDADNPEVWKDSVGTSPRNFYCDYPDFLKKTHSNVAKYSDLLIALHGKSSEQFLRDDPSMRLGYVFIDSDDHNISIVKREIDLLNPKMLNGGIIIFHDYGNQFYGPIDQANKLVASGEYELISIDWGKISGIVDVLGGEKGNDSWHLYDTNPRPNYLGAIRKK